MWGFIIRTVYWQTGWSQAQREIGEVIEEKDEDEDGCGGFVQERGRDKDEDEDDEGWVVVKSCC